VTFEEWVHSRGTAVTRFARLVTGDVHRADDLVQEVLARAYVNWRRISDADQPDMYVRRMVINMNASWWRRRSNRERVLAHPPDHPDARLADVDLVERDEMWRLLRRLPQRQRAVIVLRYYEDLDDASIAEILGCAGATVRSTAARALATLRQRYPGYETTAVRESQ
jgi:RNA polymerase sigma-70 factor (sigma-E family)